VLRLAMISRTQAATGSASTTSSIEARQARKLILQIK
jgi:hypothetical protein